MIQQFDICPNCGGLVTSEAVRGEKRFYHCINKCGWGSYKKPALNKSNYSSREKSE